MGPLVYCDEHDSGIITDHKSTKSITCIAALCSASRKYEVQAFYISNIVELV